MAHFHPLRWEIDLTEHHSSELDHDPVVQAKFVHEYVHYVQALTSTIGRYILVEMARLSAFAGVLSRYGWPPPKDYEQIHLREVLSKAQRSDFVGTEPAQQYRKFERELELVFADQPTVLVNSAGAQEQFIRLPLKINEYKVDRFVHIVSEAKGTILAIPITDRIAFENMARQVQRNYLRFNNNVDTTPVDRERRRDHGDITYVCLHDALTTVLPSSEDVAKWTITLCQIAILCRNPGTAFERMFDSLSSMRTFDLASLVRILRGDPWFEGEFNVPPIQPHLEELVGKWGTVMLIRENWELRELTKLIANASNAILGSYSLMADPLITWKDVASWVTRFGCPPIRCNDAVRDELHGSKTSAPWTWYLRRLHDLLGA